ncbi:MAG: hypothetical protein HC896_02030 [Bacteroidales bacterium]|nr:hypothetical protein [Bacteroidales bacterium]
MGNEGKITVKHYLNKRAKARVYKNEAYYPLYIQIIVAGKKAQVKSKINEHLNIYKSDIGRLTNNDPTFTEMVATGFFSDAILNKLIENKIFPIYYLMEDEKVIIDRIIRLLEPFNNADFNLSTFSNDYQKYTAEISNVLDNTIKAKYLGEVKTLFLKAIDDEENRNLFKISNFLIHFINWENSFSNYYDSTQEILPDEFKAIETKLSKELRKAIRSYMAFHSRVNIVKRFFEKREQGKLSTLSYLDWQTEIKHFIQNEFNEIFGEQKSQDYVDCLDNLLSESVIGEQ